MSPINFVIYALSTAQVGMVVLALEVREQHQLHSIGVKLCGETLF